MLPREPRSAAHREIASFAAQPPDDRPGAPVDLVDRVGVSRRDEQIAVSAELDRVDVEVVERRLPSPLGVGLRKRDVTERVPLEQDTPRRDVELLQAGVDHVAARLVEGDQGGVAQRDRELVFVAGEAVPGADEGDRAVGAAHDHVIAASAAELRAALPPGQHRPATVPLHTEIGDAEPERMEPDHPAAAVDDQRPTLPEGLLRRDEDVSRRRVTRCHVDRDRGRPEIGPRDEMLTRQPRRVNERASASRIATLSSTIKTECIAEPVMRCARVLRYYQCRSDVRRWQVLQRRSRTALRIRDLYRASSPRLRVSRSLT